MSSSSSASKLASLLALCSALGGCTAIGNFDYKFDLVADAGKPDSGGNPDEGDASGPDDDGGGLDATQADGSTCEATETSCDDDVDNDCDGMEDCKDSDCAGALACCKPTEIPERSCGDGVDNDCNGKLDCADGECLADPMFCCTNQMPEVSNDTCGDQLDNDCDGITDCAEVSCGMRMTCCVPISDKENTMAACAGGVDDDCDGLVDCADPECAAVNRNCCTPTAAGPEVACGDGRDNDCDGIVDCNDPDCAAAVVCINCNPSGPTESSCTDGVDNDCDKFRDCLDTDCRANLACCVPSGAENSAASCVDQRDNDCDGKLDCADEQCAGIAACCVPSPENTEAACRDGGDNDCDGLSDCADASCTGLGACCVPSGAEGGQCGDAKDNDCDGKPDCADSECGSAPNCCVRTGAELNNTGVDEDCDGFADLAPVVDGTLGPSFPQRDGAAAGGDVSIRITPSPVAGSTLECRSYRRGGMQGPFVACPVSAGTHRPFTAAQSAAALSNGAWQTEFRTRFANGLTSPSSNFTYYVHNSMHGAARCTSPITDAQWIAKAKERLSAYPAGSTVPQLFNPGVDTFLASPFVRVAYAPPFSGWFQTGNRPAPSSLRSLRRRFTLSSGADANRYLLVVRNYRSTHTGHCKVVNFRVHVAYHQTNWSWVNGQHEHADFACDAIVLNRAGAGVCLNATAGVVSFGQTNYDAVTNSLGFNGAKQYMWHQLEHRDNFTDKCEGASVCALHLPDRALFPGP